MDSVPSGAITPVVTICPAGHHRMLDGHRHPQPQGPFQLLRHEPQLLAPPQPQHRRAQQVPAHQQRDDRLRQSRAQRRTGHASPAPGRVNPPT